MNWTRLLLLIAVSGWNLTFASDEKLALINANLIDGRSAAAVPGRTVVIENGRITAVFGSGDETLADDMRTIDLAGKTLMPGLIDAHVHLLPVGNPEVFMARLLRNGITGVRDLGGDARLNSRLQQAADNRPAELPDLYFSANFFGPAFREHPFVVMPSRGLEPGTAPWARIIDEDDDVSSFVGEAKATGASGLKLYTALSEDLLAEIVEEADRQGLKTWVHSVIFPANSNDVVAAGPDQMIHAKGLAAAGQTGLPESFIDGVPGWVSQQDFRGMEGNEPRFQQLYEAMRDNGTMLEPALVADGDFARRRQPEWAVDMRDFACRVTAAAHQSGVRIGAGTDTITDEVRLPRELERLVDCGLSPMDALAAATVNNAMAIGIEAETGTIEPGKRADLLVLHDDPSRNISAIRNVAMVFHHGLAVDLPAAEVRAALAAERASFEKRDCEGTVSRWMANDVVMVVNGSVKVRNQRAMLAHCKRVIAALPPAATAAGRPVLQEEVNMLDDNTAWSLTEYLRSGPPGSPPAAVTKLWQRDDNGDWRIVHLHESTASANSSAKRPEQASQPPGQ